jgi:hypothetical protein
MVCAFVVGLHEAMLILRSCVARSLVAPWRADDPDDFAGDRPKLVVPVSALIDSHLSPLKRLIKTHETCLRCCGSDPRRSST